MRKIFLSLLPLVAACSGSAGPGTGRLDVVATDSPLDPALVERATIEVERIRIHAETEDEDEGGWITLYDGDPVEVGLTALRNGITELLASGELEAGTYRQLRLHLAGGRLELTNGNVYTVADGTLTTPSASTSGYKIFLDPAVEIPAGGVEQVVLDFDLTKMFQPIPGSDPLTASSYKLHPVVRASVTSISGQLRAVVRRDDGSGTLLGVPDALVHVLPPGEPDPANAIATSITDATGSAAVLGLLPGSYDVLAADAGGEDRVDGVAVQTGETSVVELVLP